MKKKILSIMLLLAFMANGIQPAVAQSDKLDFQPCWYAGIGGGKCLGQATFRSITETDSHVGSMFCIFGGYQFSRLISAEALVTMGRQTQTSLDCDPFWLATDGQRTFAPILGKQGNYYRDLEAITSWTRLAVQGNFDLLSLLVGPTVPWSVTLSPQLSAVTTLTEHSTDTYSHEFDRQWHLGLGGQGAVGYRIVPNVGLQLYGGITCMTGDRFDNIPEHCHKSNFIYEFGLKASCYLIR